jgi:hypothetical protein
VGIFNKEGKLLGKIKIPEATSNCALSPDEKTLYITADMYVVRGKTEELMDLTVTDALGWIWIVMRDRRYMDNNSYQKLRVRLVDLLCAETSSEEFF